MTSPTRTQRNLLQQAASLPDRMLTPTPTHALSGAALNASLAALVRRGWASLTSPDAAKPVHIATVEGLAAIGVTNQPSGPVGQVGPRGKLGQLLEAIRAEEGATLAELSDALGWRPHTTRAAICRLRKRGFAIERSANAGRSAYTLADR